MDAAELITLVKRMRESQKHWHSRRTHLRPYEQEVDAWLAAWDSQEEVRAVEAMGPRGERLVELTKRFPAPAGDWDQQEEVRAAPFTKDEVLDAFTGLSCKVGQQEE